MSTASIEISQGKLNGAVVCGTHVYKGIPYRSATDGASRFRPGRPPKSWAVARDCFAFGPSSPQPSVSEVAELLATDPVARSEVTALYNRLGLDPTLDDHQSESSLLLNVWTPEVRGQARPVMVWLHGGGFFGGSGSLPWYDGQNLARKGGVVVVTVNHRLGLFGFLNVAEAGGDQYRLSGNVGLIDIVHALEWVRDNIEAFGGDPENVTIFGQSGGGSKVVSLLCMPMATGLFHRAIVQSCTGVTGLVTWDRSITLAHELMAHLGVQTVSELCELPAAVLISAQGALARQIDAEVRDQIASGGVRPRVYGLNAFRPVIDGAVLLDGSAKAAVDAAHNRDIPLLIGTTQHETAPLHRPPSQPRRDFTTLIRHLRPILGDEAGRIVGEYQSSRPWADADDLFVAITTAHKYQVPSLRLAEARLNGSGCRPYVYQLRWGMSFFGEEPRSVHGIDVPLVFDNVDRAPLWASSAGSGYLADCMSRAWISFAYDGQPNHSGIPYWEPYSSEDGATMVFDDECRLSGHPDSREQMVWSTVSDSRLGISNDVGAL